MGINLGRNLMRRKKIIHPEIPAVENLVVFLYALTQSVLVTLQKEAPSDPEELLRRCEEALADGPPRFHRKFTCLSDGDGASSSLVRVMQWNVLAQGMRRPEKKDKV